MRGSNFGLFVVATDIAVSEIIRQNQQDVRRRLTSHLHRDREDGKPQSIQEKLMGASHTV
jgi:hypothetical protein